MIRMYLIFLSALLFTACGQNEQTKTEEKKEPFTFEHSYFNYFATSPYVLQLRDPNNPFLDLYYRFTPKNEKDEWIIQEFNASLILTSAYNLVYKSKKLIVKKHTVVAQGLKIEAKIKDEAFFPLFGSSTSVFSSQFPTNIDTIDVAYILHRTPLNDTIIQINNETYDCIPLNEKVEIIYLDLKNKKEKKQQFTRTVFFAKDIGPVFIISPEASSQLKLHKIYTDQEFEKMVQANL